MNVVYFCSIIFAHIFASSQDVSVSRDADKCRHTEMTNTKIKTVETASTSAMPIRGPWIHRLCGSARRFDARHGALAAAVAIALTAALWRCCSASGPFLSRIPPHPPGGGGVQPSQGLGGSQQPFSSPWTPWTPSSGQKYFATLVMDEEN